MKHADSGMTLIEVLIAVVILGLGAVVLMTGLMTASAGSGSTRDHADSRALLASVAEELDAAEYTGCADPLSLPSAYASALAAATRPGTMAGDATGAAEPVTVVDVDVWSGSTFVERSDTAACAYDQGTGASRMQRIVLRHAADSLTVIKAGR